MSEYLTTERLSDKVSDVITKILQEEGFKPGDKFHSENALAVRLGVSRSTIREALRSLEATGWISVRHGKGVFVIATLESQSEGFTGWLKSNRESVLENFEIRLILDPKAASYAARNAEAEAVVELQAICEEFRACAPGGDTARLIQIDERFHSTIAKCTKNRTLSVLMRTMARSLPVGWMSSLRIPGRVAKTIDEHCAIVAAIAAHDPQAAETAMITHLQNATKEILDFMEREDA